MISVEVQCKAAAWVRPIAAAGKAEPASPLARHHGTLSRQLGGVCGQVPQLRRQGGIIGEGRRGHAARAAAQPPACATSKGQSAAGRRAGDVLCC